MLAKLGRGAGLLSLAAALAGLGLLAYMGTYDRYWQDDWCYNRDFRSLGLLGTLRTYFATGQDALRGYSTNRYSLTLLSGLFYEAGMFGTQIVAALIIVLWLVALLWVCRNLAQLSGEAGTGMLWPAAASLLFYTLFISTQRFQILYWRSGVHYSFAIIFGLLMLGLITWQMRAGRQDWAASILIIPFAFLAGGLSEIGAAYLASAFFLLWAAAWYARKRQAAWATNSFEIISAVLVGLAAAIVVLIVSPSNSRAATMHVTTTAWSRVPFLSIRYALDFIVNSLRSLPIPHLVFFASILSMAIIAAYIQPTTTPLGTKAVALRLLFTCAVVLILITAVQAPNVRFYSAPPDPRGQSLSRFTMLCGIALFAWTLGQWVRDRWKWNWIGYAAVIGLVLGALYAGRMIAINAPQLSLFERRAQLWDQRDAEIRNAIAHGETQVTIPVIDTLGWGVQDVLPSIQMNGRWISNCGSQFYGLDAIRYLPH